MAEFVHMDNDVAQLRRVVAAGFVVRPGRSAVHLGIVLPDEGGRRQEIAVRRADPVEPEIVDMAGEQRLDAVFADQAGQPASPRFADIVVVLRFVLVCDEGRIMGEQEDPPAPIGLEIGLQPGALFRLRFQAGIEYLGVDNDEMAVAVVERPVVRPEMLLPAGEIGVADGCGRRPVIGLVADIVIAGGQVLRVPQRRRLFQIAGGGPVVQFRHGRHGMQQIADIDDESEVAPVQVVDDMAQTPIGQRVHREGRIALVLALVEVGVRDNGESKPPRAEAAPPVSRRSRRFRHRRPGEPYRLGCAGSTRGRRAFALVSAAPALRT